MKLEIDIDEDYYKIICKRVEKNKPYHSPYEYEVIADGKPIEQEPMFDKIRAEIEQLSTTTCTETRRIYIDADDFKENVLAIFDKYKAESEG